MALTMIGVLAVVAALLLSVVSGERSQMALFSLALLPSVVSWCCLVIYIYHSRSASKDDEAKVDADFMNAIHQWMTMPKDTSRAAVARPARATTNAPLAVEELTPERVTQIVGAVQNPSQSRNVA